MKKHPGARHGSPKETARKTMSGGHVSDRLPAVGPGAFALGVRPNAPDGVLVRNGTVGGKGGRTQNPRWGDDD